MSKPCNLLRFELKLNSMSYHDISHHHEVQITILKKKFRKENSKKHDFGMESKVRRKYTVWVQNCEVAIAQFCLAIS